MNVNIKTIKEQSKKANITFLDVVKILTKYLMVATAINPAAVHCSSKIK